MSVIIIGCKIVRVKMAIKIQNEILQNKYKNTKIVFKKGII